VVATKGAAVASEVVSLLAAPGVHLQVSLSTIDDGEAARLEPGAPSPSERLRLIEAVSAAGGRVGVRLAPMIPWLRSMASPQSFVAAVARVGASHVMVETLKLQRAGSRELDAAVGVDLRAVFGRARGARCSVPVERRVGVVAAIRRAAHEAGLTFGAGDDDLKVLSDSVCCCGSGLALGHGSVYPALTQRAAAVLREKDEVSWADLSGDWAPDCSVDIHATAARRFYGRHAPLYRFAAWKRYGLRGQWGVEELTGHRYKLAVDKPVATG
jgi:hypothetical protein